MQRIFADFNKLGMHGPGHENEIDLGYDDSVNLAGHEPRDGERAIFFETGSLEAAGALRSELVDGCHFWVAVLDLTTLRRLDTLESAQSSQEASSDDERGEPDLGALPSQHG